jgi:hypothetical protein
MDDALPILKCTGVVNIVSFDGKPAPIPESELDSIRVLVGSELQYDPCPMIHEGMMVEVTHGALRGVIGRLMRAIDVAELENALDDLARNSAAARPIDSGPCARAMRSSAEANSGTVFACSLSDEVKTMQKGR